MYASELITSIPLDETGVGEGVGEGKVFANNEDAPFAPGIVPAPEIEGIDPAEVGLWVDKVLVFPAEAEEPPLALDEVFTICAVGSKSPNMKVKAVVVTTTANDYVRARAQNYRSPDYENDAQ
ncbi:hypothetical protein NP233_g1265 [Leucocoprinus birnbaumii]|uniref:Uncharacterized protein n=1 Tax=Leucocoprinus birnbaumii TaxID=56174 RepID=A0AAD5W4D5_9AGAR|nr:hypothetical protein NP233_g1265 [Leucocoprinus birnbaumii]